MSTDAPPEAQPGPSATPPRARPRRWIMPTVVLGWALLLVVLACVSVRRDAPTVREQRDLGAAATVADRALGALVAAAGPDPLVELGTPRLDRGCRLSVARDGASLARTVTFRAGAEDAAELLDRISDGLPAAYRAGTRPLPAGPGPRLRADAGEFVAITGGVTAPGRIELTVATGCRPDASAVDLGPAPVAAARSSARGELDRVFDALGLAAPADPDWSSATCPAGGAAYTARTAGPGTPTGGLAAGLRSLAGAGPVLVDTPQSYGYRAGPLGVLVETVDGETRVAVSHGC
ncbi:hypothetical protein [Plantactinospora sp. KBS50]|uniref:hypothetical protein n=1 Tax=Plantactinospora sp. KBS50 TaxID=2024580 RepID=UPI000BAB19EA|nr:hypothetical protein [Plantactinospora sp. KBS50]ASW58027.1 hypothetical protein CIK06_26370 [Plantactinospora sp. KBS50]